MKYLLAGKERCKCLLVGITNPDPLLTGEDETDPTRSRPEDNPLTYFERMCMVRDALFEAGLSHQEFAIVPFPINFPDLYRYYAPLDAVFLHTIDDAWGEKKLSYFESLGLATEVLWRRTPETKGISAGDVRKLIAEDGEWQPLVPPSTARLIEEFGLAERLRALAT